MAEVDPLAVLWAARSIAVVGASERSGTPGRQVLDHLGRYGYDGTVIPVTPRGGTVLGRPAALSVPAGTELALIVVPAAAVAGAVDDCVRAGVRCAVVGSSGFAETGAAGSALQARLVAASRAGGMRLVGPNCIGSVGFHGGLVASFSPLFSGPDTVLVPGGTGFASASGALGYGTVSLALDRGLGLFAAVTTGNEADVGALEALVAMAADPRCTALLGYLESLSDGPALRALAATGKPVALLVGGGSAGGARAAASHTGALATTDRVVDGVLRQLGIARARDVDDLLDYGAAFTRAPGFRRRGAARGGDGAAGVGLAEPAVAGPGGGSGRGRCRVAVVTTSGGSGILAADAIAESGLALAELGPSTVETLASVVPAFGSVANPVDVTASVMRDRTLVGRCLDAVAADPGVDAVVVCFCVLTGDDVGAIVSALGCAVAGHGKPVLAARTGAGHLAPAATAALRAAGVPVFLTPARAVRAVAALHTTTGREPALHTTTGREPAPHAATDPEPALASETVAPAGTTARHPDPATGSGSGPSGAGEAALKLALAAAGVRVPRGRVVTDAADAPEAVVEVGRRAVLKVVVPGALHKTELGGVLLDVGPGSARERAATLLAIPGAIGVLVEEQVPAGVEVLVGVSDSPLGPLLTIGAGGVLAELLDDVAVRLLPVAAADVHDAIGATRLGILLGGFRGRPASDVDALVALVLRVTDLAAGWGGSLDLNPVVVTPDAAVVLDAAWTREG